MSRVIVLDTSPLGLVTQRRGIEAAETCRQWVEDCEARGWPVLVPAVCDYEVRRELLRAGKTAGIMRLDAFSAAEPDRYIPLTDEALKLAAELWAEAGQRGAPTADPRDLDCDVILAAQALALGLPASQVVIATTNVGHLSQFVPAELWQEIRP